MNTNKCCVLFKPEDFEEFDICKDQFNTYQYRSEIPSNSLVIGRYSVLPFYKELEQELALTNSKLINTYEQHRYIADITNYYEDIKEFTPATYSTWGDLPDGKQWVVKGATNSRKHQWDTHMYAPDKTSLQRTIDNLLGDSMIGMQGLVVREYVPLKKLADGMNGLPITMEFRLFFYKEVCVGDGFYWSEFPEFEQLLPFEGFEFAKKVAKIIAKKTNFFVLDIALTATGKWILIEVNDGQMSGLSCVKPSVLYESLSELKRIIEIVHW